MVKLFGKEVSLNNLRVGRRPNVNAPPPVRPGNDNGGGNNNRFRVGGGEGGGRPNPMRVVTGIRNVFRTRRPNPNPNPVVNNRPNPLGGGGTAFNLPAVDATVDGTGRSTFTLMTPAEINNSITRANAVPLPAPPVDPVVANSIKNAEALIEQLKKKTYIFAPPGDPLSIKIGKRDEDVIPFNQRLRDEYFEALESGSSSNVNNGDETVTEEVTEEVKGKGKGKEKEKETEKDKETDPIVSTPKPSITVDVNVQPGIEIKAPSTKSSDESLKHVDLDKMALPLMHLDNPSVITKLGGGGFGNVDLIRCADNTEYAFKSFKDIKDKDTNKGGANVNMNKEVNMFVAMGDHKNLGKAIGVATVPGKGDGIVMEYYPSKPSNKRMQNVMENYRNRVLQPNEVVGYVRNMAKQIFDGLSHLQDDSRKIVHNDIKYDNILITDQNVVKIIDPGCAALEGETQRHSKIEFAPLERIAAFSNKVHRKSVSSVGPIFLPSAEEIQGASISAVLSSSPPGMSSSPPGMSSSPPGMSSSPPGMSSSPPGFGSQTWGSQTLLSPTSPTLGMSSFGSGSSSPGSLSGGASPKGHSYKGHAQKGSVHVASPNTFNVDDTLDQPVSNKTDPYAVGSLLIQLIYGKSYSWVKNADPDKDMLHIAYTLKTSAAKVLEQNRIFDPNKFPPEPEQGEEHPDPLHKELMDAGFFDFIEHIMRPKKDERYTAAQALTHPFITGAPSDENAKQVADKLVTYSEREKRQLPPLLPAYKRNPPVVLYNQNGEVYQTETRPLNNETRSTPVSNDTVPFYHPPLNLNRHVLLSSLDVFLGGKVALDDNVVTSFLADRGCTNPDDAPFVLEKHSRAFMNHVLRGLSDEQIAGDERLTALKKGVDRFELLVDIDTNERWGEEVLKVIDDTDKTCDTMMIHINLNRDQMINNTIQDQEKKEGKIFSDKKILEKRDQIAPYYEQAMKDSQSDPGVTADEKFAALNDNAGDYIVARRDPDTQKWCILERDPYGPDNDCQFVTRPSEYLVDYAQRMFPHFNGCFDISKVKVEVFKPHVEEEEKQLFEKVELKPSETVEDDSELWASAPQEAGDNFWAAPPKTDKT